MAARISSDVLLEEGMSALEFQRELWGETRIKRKSTPLPNGSYRTSWFMCHRSIVETIPVRAGLFRLKDRS
jgi:hypothetical protein